MRKSLILGAAIALGMASGAPALAESFLPHTEDTGTSWKAWHNEVYNQQRSRYLYPGGRVPGQAYSAPGDVYGGTPAPYYMRPPQVVYVPQGAYTYQPYPPGY
ncbi:hypothetical protein [Microbaculum marinum]|uniref:Uncharacterized protein n=1 Tax=Microbaculum marinum TaxID=1764581 RepID=A0AAW9RRW2_9HYPH